MIKNYTVWKHFINILIAIDRVLNAIIAGNPSQTISSRAGRWVRDNSEVKGGFWRWLCRALYILDKNHCRDAINGDIQNKIYHIYR